MQQPLPIAKSSRELDLLPGLANRHGLITGTTGTGKTVTLQVNEPISAIQLVGAALVLAGVTLVSVKRSS
jgi:DNA helicase HerA-like ATPase